jgi:hypothetical protein
MRWVRGVIVSILALLATSGGLASYRAYYPISRVALRVSSAPIRAGTIIRVDTASSGRGPVEIRVELIQGTQHATLVLERVGSRRWAFWDFRSVSHTTRAVVSAATLERFTGGEAVVRATARGAPAWLRQPPPITDEVTVEVEPAAAPSMWYGSTTEPNEG